VSYERRPTILVHAFIGPTHRRLPDVFGHERVFELCLVAIIEESTLTAFVTGLLLLQ
jgi:hypothetical protein